VDGGEVDPVARRHNEPVTRPIIAHHIHLYLPEGAVEEAKDWYTRMFGGTPGMRWRYPATDLPGINFNFSAAPEAQAPLKGRMLDHIGFEVTNLEEFCRELEARGVRFDVAYARQASGIASAFLTDPWGTYIELTEGLDGL
jgi:catechol 2,3-dioxygenase-like lactoylglutathione lyase family enzyme